MKGVRFKLVKFRTMSKQRESNGIVLSDEQRMTRFGSWLRASSLDELPEFWNVIKGEMSLTGPRPLLVEYLDRYSVEQSQRMNVLPGITGWAQINGRNEISWEKKFELDIWYVNHRSLRLDLLILFRTCVQWCRLSEWKKNRYQVVTEFKGKKKE